MTTAPRIAPASPSRNAELFSLTAYFVGAGLGLVFLSSVLPAVAVPVAAALLTAAYGLRRLVAGPTRGRVAVGVVAWIVVGSSYVLFAYLVVAWGRVLAWSVRGWGWALVVSSLAALAFTARPSWNGGRVPAALPLGIWIACCLLGWRTEEAILRCDDYLALGDRPELELLSPTTRLIANCVPGAELTVGRFPRVIWESGDGERLIVTTQTANRGPVAGARFTGSICEIRSTGEPVCVGEGRAQGLAESDELDRLFFASWGHRPTGGELIAIPRHGPLEIVASTPTEGSLGELFHEPRTDRIYGFTDEGFEVLPFVASTLAAEPARAAPLLPPGAIRYDRARGEGVICGASGPLIELGGSAYLSIAVRGSPLEMRPLGGGEVVARASLTWGCDWDPETRRVYVAIPNLGVLATLDYDSGEALAHHAIGFGLRSVTLDRARARLYLTDFLGGAVVALDADSGVELARWPVGRFPRTTTVSHDGTRLFVGTNVGLVAIDLEGTRAR